MQAPIQRWVQIFLAGALIVAALRLAHIFYQRSRPPQPPRSSEVASRPVPADYFVHIPRAYLSTFHSAQKLKGSVVGIRDGYRYGHFPFDARRRRSREIEDPPLLAPIQRITIAEVVREPTERRGVDEINVIFEDPAPSPTPSPTFSQTLRAITIGHCDRRRDSCRFYFDEMFFLKDPRELYAHWPQEAWEAVGRGEVQEGMSETQISFAVGFGRLLPKETAATGSGRVVEFRPPGRRPLVVTFGTDGNAHRIQVQ